MDFFARKKLPWPIDLATPTRLSYPDKYLQPKVESFRKKQFAATSIKITANKLEIYEL